MVFARLLRNLVRDPTVGALVAPIVSDEARTFGLEPIIAEAKIYAPDGQNYIPVDADLPLNYAESSSGQVLQEGITEAGALAAFTALSTAYATWGQPMVPVYLFYSMFGFQRVGDLAWALGDMRGRGILAGCTAGRTTLMGEGLQHDDGQSPLLASTNPAALVYDASFAYEVAVIMEAAVTDMLGPNPADRFWYLTLYNETYPMPALPEGDEGAAVRRGIIDGALPLRRAARDAGRPGGHAVLLRAHVERRRRGPARAGRTLRGGGGRLGGDVVDPAAHRRARSGALEPAASRIRAQGARTSRPRWAPDATPWSPSPTTCAPCPTRSSRFVDRPYVSLGTDGFGRSDARERAARVLRGRCGPPRGGRPATALARRTRRSLRSSPTPSPSRASTPNERRPSGCEHGHEGGHRLLRARRARGGTACAAAAPMSIATSKNGQHCFSRCASSTAATRAASDGSSTRCTAVGSASTATTDVATSARHSSTRSANDPASRLQAIGMSAQGSALMAPPRARRA